VLVVDRLVAGSPQQFGGGAIAERRDGGGVGEPDQARVIHDPDRLRHGLQHGSKEVLGTDLQGAQMI
jgi:hypothetical protein